MAETLKPEVAQEIIDWLAIGDFKTPDEFKTNFNKKFLTGDDVLKSKPVKDKIGALIGSYNTELKRVFKTYGIELASNEIEEDDGNGNKIINPVKIADVAAKKLQEANNKVQEDLKSQIGASTDEKIKALETKYGKLNTDYESLGKINLDYKTKLEEKDKEVETVKKSATAEVNSFIRADLEEKEWSNFPFAEEADPFAREGFRSHISKKAKFELSDKKVNGKPVLEVRNVETGELFEDPTRKGQFLSPSDFLKAEGIEANKKSAIFKINESGGTKTSGTGWVKRDPDRKTDPKDQPKLAVNVSKNLPSTVKSEVQ